MVLHFNHKCAKTAKKKAKFAYRIFVSFFEKPLPLGAFYGYFDRLKPN